MYLNNKYYNIITKMDHIKNPVFIENSKDPFNGKFVKKIWLFKKTKLGRTKRDLIWIYMRHRGKLSVADVLKKYKCQNREAHIYYRGECQPRKVIL